MINYARIYAAYESERTASFYPDGLLDTGEHRRLQADRAELVHQHARREVGWLHLIVGLLGTQASEGMQGRAERS